MTHRRAMPLDISIESDGEYSGHRVLIAGKQVAFRTFSGRDSDDVQQEIATVLGELLLARLQEKFPARDYGHGHHEPGAWLHERPEEEW